MKKLCACMALILALCALPALAGDAARVCGDFRYVPRADGTAEITGWTGGATELDVPASLDGVPVSALGARALAGHEELTRVRLPEGTDSIGERAFADCGNLAGVDLPEGLQRIGDGAFEECLSLKSIALPASVTSVGDNPFMGCDALAEIAVPEGNAGLSVKDGALFADSGARLVCYPRALTRPYYTVPEGTIRIGDHAFHYCDSLVTVALPDSVTQIGPSAFDGIQNVTLMVHKDSAAEAYAVANAMKYVYPDSAAWLND